MYMQATVLEVQWERLLVLDRLTQQKVIVNTPDARWFLPGDLVRILYNGVMTRSIPPQIFAQNITLLSREAVPPIVIPPIVRPPVIFPPIVRPPVVFPPIFLPPRRPKPRPPRPHR